MFEEIEVHLIGTENILQFFSNIIILIENCKNVGHLFFFFAKIGPPYFRKKNPGDHHSYDVPLK